MSRDSFNVTRPNSKLGGADPFELVLEEFAGIVEESMQTRSVTEGWVDMKTVKGTATVTKDAIGESTLQVLEPGKTPDGTANQFSDNSVTVKTVILARSALPLLDVFQTKYDVRKKIGNEHGKKMAKFRDAALLVQLAKAGLATESKYGDLPGHHGGTQITLAAAGDENDPAKLYKAINRLCAGMEEKDVIPQEDGHALFVRPSLFYTLMDAEQIINGDYITSVGNVVQGVPVLKALGVPIIKTNNMPHTNTVSTPDDVAKMMGGDYSGDFSKLLAILASPAALLCGETISLTSDVFYDKLSKSHYVDAHMAFAATTDRHEHAGAILAK
ncbi:major head protein [Pseudomonas phage VSW-3]|uniref:Capsid and scaffold protein n=1 Tax=Pseudomonas phage VSW-3 TaxID=1852562 RepID=A0A173GCR2_9CAUD|nr:major head protein [Pseudomonas phage VSW-3]ANH51097.1 capsid and scaffold protein [Pseudomonas phage VSW-3]